MKIYFGLFVRFVGVYYGMRKSGAVKKYRLELDDENYLDPDSKICATCAGCGGYDHTKEMFMCIPFETGIEIYDAESPEIPCSKYKRMEYKKL